ncbi:tyrosine-protein kinase receptor TYRO3 [Echeneis naucrates]|uniref:tyrosine-protein kinase receptor TYRO3 n=1 Tax=Echeneis naucrates TaxID=173247 RepID=UPI001113334B|nr:tyrosine-protein kinase receptor TYRO3-like [Echeneis naucrates]
MDVAFSQEEEPSGVLSQLQVHFYDTDTPISRFQDRAVLELQTSKPFPVTVPLSQISSYLNYSLALKLGSVKRQGFQIAFLYSGTCVLLTSIRLYYRRCPEIMTHLAWFGGAGAGSGPLSGSCVKGAVEVSLPIRECHLDGVWGPLQGGCACEPGHQVMGDTCQACRMGFYKSANDSAGCQLCPANSRTHVEGSERCDCLQGFSRLPTEPDHLSCTRKEPGVVVTVTPELYISKDELALAAHHYRRMSMWLTVGVLFAILLLMAVIPMVVCLLRRNYTQHSSDPDTVELFPINIQRSYQCPEVEEAAPQEDNMAEGVAHLLEGVSERLLASLKDVLIARNKLTLGKELGKGEFGSVYEGVFNAEEGLHIKVAVKTMKVGIYNQEELHEFLREAEIMKSFDHENVVKLLGVTLQREQGSSLPVPLVLLPYMKHGDLRHFLIATRYGDIPMFVPHQSLLRFMIDIAAGMNYLSSQGFLHRDLAARNCMLGDDLRVSVADFGLSKKVYSSNYYRQKVAIRVPIKWLAMESLSESVYTTKSDVWSFGVTMWEIVSWGRTPYPGVQNNELLDLLLSGMRLKPPEGCDHKLYEVMLSCWDTKPNRRPGFEELGEKLKSLLLELPVLEACQEASYINQGLEAASAMAASLEQQTNSGGRGENVYLPSPAGAAADKADDMEEEGGYLKYSTDSMTMNNNH